MAKTPRDKALRDKGLAALCKHIRAIKATADESGSAVVALAETLEKSLQEIEEALNDFPQSTPVTIPAEGWKQDEPEEDEPEADLEDGLEAYTYYFDIPVEDVTAADHATVTIAPESLGAAVACGLCPTNETIQGAIRLRAASEPETAIKAEYWIEPGKE